ncbi:MAG: hypothetical protein AAF443_03780 [Chlamydiota bacterium]
MKLNDNTRLHWPKPNLWHSRIEKTESGGGSPVPSPKTPPVDPSLKKLKTKVLHQLNCLELSSCVNSRSHKEQAIEALRKKTIDPNTSWDNIKNPFHLH